MGGGLFYGVKIGDCKRVALSDYYDFMTNHSASSTAFNVYNVYTNSGFSLSVRSSHLNHSQLLLEQCKNHG
jgi:hypothetical protein